MHTRMTRTVAVIALLLLTVAAGQYRVPKLDPEHPPRAGDEGVFYGPLVRIKEHDQPYGEQARRELKSLTQGQQLVIVPVETDGYGRTVAHIWNGDSYLNAEMVRRGAAWFYSKYAATETLYYVEEEARNAKRGL